LIVVTQHYDTLQAIGADANSNLILLPNSPQAGSDMLNNMVASFTASNQVGEMMKLQNKKLKPKADAPHHLGFDEPKPKPPTNPDATEIE